MSRKTISGFTTTYNCFEMHYPFEECIRSLLGFCDEVSIADAGSTDGTLEALERLQKEDSRIKIAVERVDFSHPRWAIYQDGYLKAKAREGCTSDFCWQTDTDEIVAPEDYEKIRNLPGIIGNTPLIMLPMIEFWGSLETIRADFFSWKPRFSVNDKRITHGIPREFRCYDSSGHEYPRPYDSDSCNYIYRDSLESVPIVIPVDMNSLRNVSLGTKEYEKLFNNWLEIYPPVYHVSWLDLRRKIKHYKTLWRRFHASMYNLTIEDNAENNVMFEKSWSAVSEKDMIDRAQQLKEIGPRFFHKKIDLNHRGHTMPLSRPIPESLRAWHVKELAAYEKEDMLASRKPLSDMPLVSAVIRSENQTQYLQEVINSVAAQNYQQIEIIVVNDGDSLSARHIVEDAKRFYPQRDIRLIDKKCGGSADAKNFGIRQARGEFVMLLDAGDLLRPDYVSKGMQFLKTRGVNLFCSNVEISGARQGEWIPNDYNPYFIRYDNSIPKAAIFDRSLWNSVGGFKVSLPHSEDWDFWINCSRKGLNVLKVPEKLYTDRVVDTGVSSPVKQEDTQIHNALVVVANEDLYAVEEVLNSQQSLMNCQSDWQKKVMELEAAHPHDWLAKFLMGLSFERQSLFDDAKSYYGEAIEKSSFKNWQPLYRLALLLEQSNHKREALEFHHNVRMLRADMARVVNSKMSFLEQSISLD